MLTLYHNGEQIPVDNTEYYVRELASGQNEVIFSLSIYDPVYAAIQEEEQITDRGGQRYLVKQIDAGQQWAKIVCILDLDDWKSEMLLDYSNNSDLVSTTISNVAPAGWFVVDRSLLTIRRTISGNLTPFEVCLECVETYGVYIQWDNKTKVCTILSQVMGDPVGSFASRQLNLKEIQYKGKSNSFATRLYPYGKEDDSGKPLSIKGLIIDGVPYPYEYVENHTYSDKIISVYWSDERYTVQENLYEDAVRKLAELAVPARSYDCAIVDLQATNPDLYHNLDFSLFTVATLIDDIKGTAVNYQVVERHIYPYHPEQNQVIFDKSPQKITNSVTQITAQVEREVSGFQSIIDERVESATRWLTSADGYVVARQDDNGAWKEILFLDTPDMATAQNVLRINTNGIGFSTTGVNGQYRNAWTIDGQLVADFITTGTLTGNIIRAGLIASHDGSCYFDLDNNILASSKLITPSTVVVPTAYDPGKVVVDVSYTQISSTNYQTYAKFYRENTPDKWIAINPYSSRQSSTVTYLPGIITQDDLYIISGTEPFKSPDIGRSSARIHLTNTSLDLGLYLNAYGFAPAIRLYSSGGTNYIDCAGTLTCSNAEVAGTLTVRGSKSRVVDTDSYGDRLLYAYETPAPMFGDVGEGVLDDTGECVIALDDVFRETIAGMRYQVFLQKEGRGDIWVDSKESAFFVVQGTPGLRFAWEIKAVQKGYEITRLEAPETPANDLDINYYYEDAEAWISRQEEVLNNEFAE